jgi:Tol biopolymer transport system component
MIETPKRKNDDKLRRWVWPLVVLTCIAIGVALAVVMMAQAGCRLPAVPSWPTQTVFMLHGAGDYRFDINTRQLTRIESDPRSPDGQWQAAWISSEDMDYSRFLMLTSTIQYDAKKNLGHFYGARETFSWSPDSQWLAVSAYSSPNGRWRPEKLDLHLVNILTGELKPLVIDIGMEQDEAPVFSPDGRRVAFRRMDHLWVVQLDTHMNPGAVYPMPIEQEVSAIGWSDDGQWLLALSAPTEWLLPDNPQITFLRADRTGQQVTLPAWIES